MGASFQAELFSEEKTFFSFVDRSIPFKLPAKRAKMDSRGASSSAIVRRPTFRRPNAVSTFVRQRPRAAATLSLWVLGLFIAFLAPAPIASASSFFSLSPFLSPSSLPLTSRLAKKKKKTLSTVTKEAAARYEHSLRKAASQGPELAAAERSVAAAAYAVSAEASWFWRFQGPEKRAAVAEAKAGERAARARLEKIYLRGDEMIREGKQALGLWSQAGVDESRKTFKRAFENGKVFARRQTLWVSFFCFLKEFLSFFLGIKLTLSRSNSLSL